MVGGKRYREAGRLYPIHLRFFTWMHDRAKKWSGTDLARNASGLLEFVEEIGPVPTDMQQPSVGRKDHSKGYVRGNYEWQDLLVNSRNGAPEIRGLVLVEAMRHTCATCSKTWLLEELPRYGVYVHFCPWCGTRQEFLL